MIPLVAAEVSRFLDEGGSPHRSVALEHAARHGRPRLWGDSARRPSSVVCLREAEGRWEAFGAGEPGPAVDWFAARTDGRPFTLAAPGSWEPALRGAIASGTIRRAEILAWSGPARGAARRAPAAVARRLGPDDGVGFSASAPEWALRAWGDYDALAARGAAFGVPMPGSRRFAALAWTFESGRGLDRVAVATLPRYRRLGLGHAAASALLGHIAADRRREALWTASPENAASIALAGALGLTPLPAERLVLWQPSPGRRATG